MCVGVLGVEVGDEVALSVDLLDVLGHLREDPVVFLHVPHESVELLLDRLVVYVRPRGTALIRVLTLRLLPVDVGVHVEGVGSFRLHLNL